MRKYKALNQSKVTLTQTSCKHIKAIWRTINSLISGYVKVKVTVHEKRAVLDICVFQDTDIDENGIKTVYDLHH